MNGFRITILTLLCLSVGLMFYAVLFVIPDWQDRYSAYESLQKIDEYDNKNDIHRQQMAVFDPSYETPEVEQARLGVEEAERRGEQTLIEAEEHNVVAAARRRAEAAQARAREEEKKEVEAASSVVGYVASYDRDYQFVMIQPKVPQAFFKGAVMALRRNKKIVCEAVVDAVDAESGQVSATVKLAQITVQGGESTSPEPVEGDEVIPSPFLSSDELKSGQGPQSMQPLIPSPVPSASPVDAVSPVNSSEVPPLDPIPGHIYPVEDPAGQQQAPASDSEIVVQDDPAVTEHIDAADLPPSSDPYRPADAVQRAMDGISNPNNRPTATGDSLPSLDASIFPAQS